MKKTFSELLSSLTPQIPPRPPRDIRHAPLTSQLKTKDSPISEFLAEHLPAAGDAVADYRAQMTGAQTTRPDVSRGYDWSAVGRVIEYRLLMGVGYLPSFEPIPGTRGQKLTGVVRAAALGVGAALHQAQRTNDKAWWTIAGLGLGLPDLMTDPTGPVPEILDGRERTLIRALYVQSWFETLYRSGTVPPQLAGAADDQTLLDRVPDIAVQDVWNVVSQAWTMWQAYRSVPQTSIHYNPVMPLSLRVPADGDVVIDGLLVDVKSTINPDRFGRQEIQQLAGYLLMDTRDKYGMNACGLYMARQNVMVRWDLDQFITMTSAGKYGGGDLPSLRRMLADHLSE